jgi:sugar diacid utilization regulator
MSPRVTSLRTVAEDGHREAMRAIAARLAAQKEQLGRRVVARSQEEIVDYQAPSDRQLSEDQLAATLEFVDALVASLQSGEPVSQDLLDRVREVAARRVHQGVPLEAFLRAVRLWASVSWEAVLKAARTDLPGEREAALQIAGRLADLSDRIADAATNAYLDEATDRGLLRRDLLDALLGARGDTNAALRLATRLHLRLEENYVVIVVRGQAIELEASREQSPAARGRLDAIVEQTRRTIRPRAGALLTGMRSGELVVLYPVSAPDELEAVRNDCQELARTLGDDISIGMSGWHEGRSRVGIAYAEARNAVALAARLGISGRAVGLEEVLVDHLLDASAPAQRILEEILRPLVAYDRARQAALVPTLRAYVDARFNVTKAADELYVNPNTVVYRLRRIKELSGRDPHDVDDLLVLILALKLADLRSDSW